MHQGQEVRVELQRRLEDAACELHAADSMAEAGRKVLLTEFRKVLAHEAGSRSGADIEDLHQLRVAMRKSRSIMRTLRPWYRRRVMRRHARALRAVMRASGPVRDYDVLRESLIEFAPGQPEALARSLAALERQRANARGKLLFALYSDAWERFLPEYTDFLTTPGAGPARRLPRRMKAIQVRHVLPLLVQQHLTGVLAFEPALGDADAETLHALRIECKRLRYTVATFASILGPETGDYIAALKQMQDLLGRLNDIAVAGSLMPGLMPGLDFAACEFLNIYRQALEEEQAQLLENLDGEWQRFVSREVRQQLALAMLAL